MVTNKPSSILLTTQVQETLHQARKMEQVANSFARFAASLIRVPILLCQTLTLVLAVPFVGAHALTALLDRSAERMDRTLESRLSHQVRARPGILSKPVSSSSGSFLRPSPIT